VESPLALVGSGLHWKSHWMHGTCSYSVYWTWPPWAFERG